MAVGQNPGTPVNIPKAFKIDYFWRVKRYLRFWPIAIYQKGSLGGSLCDRVFSQSQAKLLWRPAALQDAFRQKLLERRRDRPGSDSWTHGCPASGFYLGTFMLWCLLFFLSVILWCFAFFCWGGGRGGLVILRRNCFPFAFYLAFLPVHRNKLATHKDLAGHGWV